MLNAIGNSLYKYIEIATETAVDVPANVPVNVPVNVPCKWDFGQNSDHHAGQS